MRFSSRTAFWLAALFLVAGALWWRVRQEPSPAPDVGPEMARRSSNAARPGGAFHLLSPRAALAPAPLPDPFFPTVVGTPNAASADARFPHRLRNSAQPVGELWDNDAAIDRKSVV
jgi:hypothetical protein